MKTNMDRLSVGTIKRMMDKDGYDNTVHILLKRGGGDMQDGLTIIFGQNKKKFNYKMNEYGEVE